MKKARYYKDHLVRTGTTIKESLIRLNELAKDAILFVINEKGQLMGSLTDGDVRRGLINGITIDKSIDSIVQPNPRFIRKGERDIRKVIKYREENLKVIPVLDYNDCVISVINFGKLKSYLPIDAVVMAGGKGTRLRPLTENTPKPLLHVGDKPILEHHINRLTLFGIDDLWITVNYLGDQIEQYFDNGNQYNTHIQYIWEDKPMGTIGAVTKIDDFRHDYVLVTNSDILTDLNYEDFFLYFLEEDADLAVVTIPYKVQVPYAVLETSNGHVLSFKEKPSYTYYSNGGIYLMKRKITEMIPNDIFYNATDLMENLIKEGMKVISYSLNGYWLDIGSHEDFEKAQRDINQIKIK